jgi:hypothetical protein
VAHGHFLPGYVWHITHRYQQELVQVQVFHRFASFVTFSGTTLQTGKTIALDSNAQVLIDSAVGLATILRFWHLIALRFLREKRLS